MFLKRNKIILIVFLLVTQFACNQVGTFKADETAAVAGQFTGVEELRVNFNNTYSLFWTPYSPTDGTRQSETVYDVYMDVATEDPGVEAGESKIEAHEEGGPADVGLKVASVRGMTTYQVEPTLEKGTIYRFQVFARTPTGLTARTKNVIYFSPSIATDGSNGKAAGVFAGLDSAIATSKTEAVLAWTNLPEEDGAIYRVYQVGKTSEIMTTTESPVNVPGLISGNTYSFYVRAFDCIDAFCSHDGNTVIRTVKMPSDDPADDVPPGSVSNLSDGLWHNSAFQTPLISWTAATDDEAVSHYEIAIGSAPGGVDIKSWSEAGSNTSTSLSGLFLTNGASYYPSIRAIDTTGNVGAATAGDGWAVDSTKPNAMTSSVLASEIHTNRTTTPSLTWSAVIDPSPSVGTQSGLSHYELAIGTAKNGIDVQSWTDVGNITSTSLTDLPLIFGTDYHLSVRAVDIAGNANDVFPGGGDSDVAFSLFEDYSRTPTQQLINPRVSKFVKPDTEAAKGLNFGKYLSTYGDYAVVGNYYQTYSGSNANPDELVEIFKYIDGEWKPHQMLFSENDIDYFGRAAITMYKEWLFMPAYMYDGGYDNTGVVYIYKRNSVTDLYEYTQTINGGPFKAHNSKFGISMTVYEDVLVVSGYFSDDDGDTTDDSKRQGLVFVFRRSGDSWNYETELRASNAEDKLYFGNRLAAGENIIAASSDVGNNNPGIVEQVYVFTYDGGNWTEQDIILNSPSSTAKYFGSAIEIDGSDILVGCAKCDHSGKSDSGSVFHYKTADNSSWTLSAELSNISAANAAYYGTDIRLHDNKLIVAGWGGGAGTNSNDGDLVVYEKTNGIWTQKSQVRFDWAEGTSATRWVYSYQGLAAGKHGILAGSEYGDPEDPTNPGNVISAINSGLVTFMEWRQYIDSAFVEWITNDPTTTPTISWTLHGDTNASEVDSYEVKIGTSYGDDDILNWYDVGNVLTTTVDNLSLNFDRYYVSVRAKLKSGLYDKPYSAGSFFVNPDYANTVPTETTLDPADPDGMSNAASADQYGTLTSDGQYLFIGGPLADGPTTSDDGVVIVYKYENGDFTETQRLDDFANGGGGDGFGSSLAVANGVLAVGEFWHDDAFVNQGRVHIYKLSGDTWVADHVVEPSDPGSTNEFGSDVTLSGDGTILVVAAVGHEQGTGVDDTGKVYIYEHDGTTFTNEYALHRTREENEARFGDVVRLSPDGNTLVVSSPNHDADATATDEGTDDGHVQIYERLYQSRWIELDRLKSAEAAGANPQLRFGGGLAFDGETIAIGEQGSHQDGSDTGVVRIYRRFQGRWLMVQTLSLGVNITANLFGTEVLLHNGVLAVVTQKSALHANMIEGSVHIFTVDPVTKLYAFERTVDKSVSEPGSRFGYPYIGQSDGMVMLDDKLIISAQYYDTGGVSKNGQVFMFDFGTP